MTELFACTADVAAHTLLTDTQQKRDLQIAHQFAKGASIALTRAPQTFIVRVSCLGRGVVGGTISGIILYSLFKHAYFSFLLWYLFYLQPYDVSEESKPACFLLEIQMN